MNKNKKKAKKTGKLPSATKDPHLAQAAQKFTQADMPPGMRLVNEPVEGAEKMSAVMLELIEPFTEFIHTLLQMKQLVGIGAIAWNATLSPPAEARKLIFDAMHGMGVKLDDMGAFLSLVEKLMQRKRTLFPKNDRSIIKFEVIDTGDTFHLSVLSSYAPDEAVSD